MSIKFSPSISSMNMRNAAFNEVFKGKTIESVDGGPINIITFKFSDGTAIGLEVEYFGNGLTGVVIVPSE